MPYSFRPLPETAPIPIVAPRAAPDRVISTAVSLALRGEGHALLRQLPVLVLVAAASLLVLVVPSAQYTDPLVATWGFGLLALATALAILLDRLPELTSWHNVPLALDVVALGLLRSATGVTGSLYATIVILVVVWLALNDGRRYIAYATLGAGLTVVLPGVAAGTYVESPLELLRALFTMAVYALVALVINEVARQARRRYAQLAVRESDYAQDLRRGAETQRTLLPTAAPTIDGWALVGRSLPARVVGGDFYDWYPASGGYAFTLADAMGKGIGAGIVAASARALLRTGRAETDPVLAVRRADKGISADMAEATRFGTAFHARLVPETGQISYVDAGHGLAIVVDPAAGFRRLPSTGAPIGLGLGLDWATETFVLKPSETLVCVSDGMLDLYPSTEAALAAVAVICARAASAQDLVDEVAAIAASVNPSDDVTIIALRRAT